MPAYVIADVKVIDPERYKAYAALAPGAIEAAGGEYLVRGGSHVVFEGQWQPNRMVVAKFPSMEAAQAFYDSARYAEARAKRAGATEYFNMVAVEGL